MSTPAPAPAPAPVPVPVPAPVTIVPFTIYGDDTYVYITVRSNRDVMDSMSVGMNGPPYRFQKTDAPPKPGPLAWGLWDQPNGTAHWYLDWLQPRGGGDVTLTIQSDRRWDANNVKILSTHTFDNGKIFYTTTTIGAQEANPPNPDPQKPTIGTDPEDYSGVVMTIVTWRWS